ncbi:MAG TPA: NAD+ synthase [Methanoregula sp.]|nr:NAD+ synthase [Methanoregula sp.]
MAQELGCRMGLVEQMIRHEYWSSGAAGIVIGLSGGIDSAVAAVFCCRAVGADKVLGLSLPSAVSNPDDIRDAADLCRKFGMAHRTVSIEPILAGFRTIPEFRESRYLVGNLMARARMAVLYYHANRDNRIVCGTSNRSELMLGYCTKFGDNAADIQPIVHLYKTEIYAWAEELGIPEAIIRKTPSAGLWEGQSDEGEIGLTYAEIDRALVSLGQRGWKAGDPVEEKVLALVRKSAHKRMPAPNLLTEPQGPGDTPPGC